MPVDIHPEMKVSAVELILGQLHAGNSPIKTTNSQVVCMVSGFLSSMRYQNVLVTVRRDSQVYQIAFENGDKVEDLHVIGTCGKRNTGTSVHFWPDGSYFDSPKFSVTRLTHNLKAKAVYALA